MKFYTFRERVRARQPVYQCVTGGWLVSPSIKQAISLLHLVSCLALVELAIACTNTNAGTGAHRTIPMTDQHTDTHTCTLTHASYKNNVIKCERWVIALPFREHQPRNLGRQYASPSMWRAHFLAIWKFTLLVHFLCRGTLIETYPEKSPKKRSNFDLNSRAHRRAQFDRHFPK